MPAGVPAGAGAALAALVLGVDAVLASRSWGVAPLALLDWTAHLATAALALLAASRLGLRLAPRTAATVLACAVLIDLDHLALYAGVPGAAGAGGRPLTHSLLTVAVLLALGGVLRRRWPVAAAAGVLLHLLRDVATGPGVALLWPSDVVVRVPYLPYALLVGALAAVGAWRAGERPAPPGATGSSRRPAAGRSA